MPLSGMVPGGWFGCDLKLILPNPFSFREVGARNDNASSVFRFEKHLHANVPVQNGGMDLGAEVWQARFRVA